MHECVSVRRDGTGFLLVLALSIAGCATSATSARRSPAAPTLAADVDPTRAFIALGEIQPAMARPEGPDSRKPLSERSAAKLETAQALMADQRYTEAAVELEAAFRYDPNHPEIHTALAVLHWEAGNAGRAGVHAEQALMLDPGDVRARFVSGHCRAKAGDLAGAITAYRTVLLCSAADRAAGFVLLCHYELAEALALEGYLTAALEEYAAFEKAASAHPVAAGPPALSALLQVTNGSTGESRSAILERLGRFSEAADVLTPAVAANQDDAALGMRYVRLMMQAGRLDEARTAARAISSDDDEVIDLLRELHLQAGHPERLADDIRDRLSARPDESRLVLHLADALQNAQQPDEMRRVLQGYLLRHPDAADVRGRLIRSLAGAGMWHEAVRIAADGIRLDPERADALTAELTSSSRPAGIPSEILEEPEASEDDEATAYVRGVLASASELAELAERWFRASLTHRPEFLPARVSLARLLLREYRYAEALQVAGRREAEVPEAAVLERILGEICDRLDDENGAEQHLRAASQLDRDDTEAMLDLAELYRRSRRPLQAQRQLRILLERNPDHERARELLGFLYLREGKVDAAFGEFEELNRRATTPAVKGRCEAALGDFPPQDPAKYRAALQDSLGRYPADARTWIAVADSYSEFDEDQEPVRRAYLAALEIEPVNEEAMLGLVRVCQRLLLWEDAIAYLTELLPRRPNRASWRRHLIELHLNIQDYDTALTLLQEWLARQDLDKTARDEYRLLLLDTLWVDEQSAEAIALIKKWAADDPDDWEWAARLAGAFVQDGQASKAVPILEARRKTDPTDRTVQSALAETLVAAGQNDRAAQTALEWFYDDPENDRPVALMASVLANAERADDAIELVRSRLLHTSNRQAFQNSMIGLLKQAGHQDECIKWIEDLLDGALSVLRAMEEPVFDQMASVTDREEMIRLPDEPYAFSTVSDRLTGLRLNLAQELIAAERSREAEQQIQAWLEEAPDPNTRFGYLLALAWAQQELEEDSQAAQTMERALILRPDDVHLNNDVAYGWIDRGVRLEEAEAMIRFVVWQAPRQGAYLDTIGWLMYKKGEFAESRKWLGRANRALAGGDPVVLDHLGDACWRLGLADEAIAHWTAAVTAVEASDPEAEAISADYRRVRESSPAKIEAARSGGVPDVAPLASDEPADAEEVSAD